MKNNQKYLKALGRKKTIIILILLLAGFIFLGTLSFYGYKLKTSRREIFSCKDCNIIILSLNAFRKDHLPCFGYAKNTAPNLCSLAEESLVFENFITQANITAMSFVSMFTGQHPSTNKYLSPLDQLDEAIERLPSVLKKNSLGLTMKNNILIPGAGIDVSNGNGYYTLWPRNPQKTANAN